ncbi:MAG TPA: hypothetical protein VD794_00510, partial [Flavisolibacter sp.]|nr:hypothetical protein [Flavisolibacter sp.]
PTFAKYFSIQNCTLMAKQVGPLFITGTIDGVIFYKLGEKYYIRSKGAYKSGKQMRKDPYYRRTIEKADQFGAASKLVRWVYYRHLPRAARKHGLFGKLTGMANRLLQAGKGTDEVREALIIYCKTLQPVKPVAGDITAEVKTPEGATAKTGVPATSTTDLPVRITPALQKSKQARYLSRWKVKRNGRLHIPQQKGMSLLDNHQVIATVSPPRIPPLRLLDCPMH